MYALVVETVAATTAQTRVQLTVLVTPKVRGDCLPGGVNEARPCKHTACPHHMTRPQVSCVLDVTDNGPATLEEVGEIMGISRDRIRQIEGIAIRKVQARGGLRPWRDY